MEYCNVCQSAFYPHIGCFCKRHGTPMTAIVKPPTGLRHPLFEDSAPMVIPPREWNPDAHLGAVEL